MDSLWGNLFKGERKKKEQIYSILRDIRIFSDLNWRELHMIESVLHKRHYASDEVIFSQGSMGAGMYIVVDGTVSIILEPSGDVLSEPAEGEFFGELALLDESPRTATAVAKTPCTLLGFFQADLYSLMDRRPRLGCKVIMKLGRIVGRRLIECNNINHMLSAENSELKEKPGG